MAPERTARVSMVAKIFGGLSFSGDERPICKKMALAAQRWPFVNLKTGIFSGGWFGETLPGRSEPWWCVDENRELIYGKRDSLPDEKREATDSPPFNIHIVVRPQAGEVELWSGIGSIPLFYAFDAANLIIGTDPTVVCAGLRSAPELDPAGIMSLFALDYQTPTRTLFKRVKRVPPPSSNQGWRGRLGGGHVVCQTFRFVFPPRGVEERLGSG